VGQPHGLNLGRIDDRLDLADKIQARCPELCRIAPRPGQRAPPFPSIAPT
jgi:hypothetical protein